MNHAAPRLDVLTKDKNHTFPSFFHFKCGKAGYIFSLIPQKKGSTSLILLKNAVWNLCHIIHVAKAVSMSQLASDGQALIPNTALQGPQNICPTTLRFLRIWFFS